MAAYMSIRTTSCSRTSSSIAGRTRWRGIQPIE